jgi:DNA-binding IclR family transcriptional regulator
MSSSAKRALQILQAVGEADAAVGVSELARQLHLSGGTAFRSLDALERGGYVQRYQASSRYMAGSMVHRLRQRLFASFPLRNVAMPYLRQLAFATGETSSLTVMVGWYAVRIAAAPGTNDVTSSPPLGRVGTLADNAAGQVILAFRPDEDSERFAAWAKQRGAPRAWSEERGRVRQRGFAVQALPFAAGRGALALPVRGPHGAVAAIAVEGPVLDLQNPCYHDDLARWIETVAALENLVRTRPELTRNPFDHLDPNEIVLRTTG